MTAVDRSDTHGLRILHLCLASFYIDGYSYQENLLPKYHQKSGHEVKIIASLVSFNDSGELTSLPQACSYSNEDGIPVVRLDYWPGRIASRLRIYKRLIAEVENFRPDIIFAHGPQFADAWRIARHVRRNPGLKLYVDNHADFANSGRTWLSRTLLHKGLWRVMAQSLSKASERMFGVLPARVEFLTDVYKVPSDKVSFLPMGADDDLLDEVTPSAVSDFRQRHGIAPDDFLIVAGGKVDSSKRGILALMRAAKNLPGRRVRLLVFGTVVTELRQSFESLIDDEQVKFAGWLDSLQSTLCFGAADLVVFPGGHSVYWEQVCAIGTPVMVVGRSVVSHIDLGGNCAYLKSDSQKDIEDGIRELVDRPQTYQAMLAAAKSPKRHSFSYRAIADESIKVGA